MATWQHEESTGPSLPSLMLLNLGLDLTDLVGTEFGAFSVRGISASQIWGAG